jgi:hypothetical protein
VAIGTEDRSLLNCQYASVAGVGFAVSSRDEVFRDEAAEAFQFTERTVF